MNIYPSLHHSWHRCLHSNLQEINMTMLNAINTSFEHWFMPAFKMKTGLASKLISENHGHRLRPNPCTPKHAHGTNQISVHSRKRQPIRTLAFSHSLVAHAQKLRASLCRQNQRTKTSNQIGRASC